MLYNLEAPKITILSLAVIGDPELALSKQYTLMVQIANHMLVCKHIYKKTVLWQPNQNPNLVPITWICSRHVAKKHIPS